jgi:hypothetical protein
VPAINRCLFDGSIVHGYYAGNRAIVTSNLKTLFPAETITYADHSDLKRHRVARPITRFLICAGTCLLSCADRLTIKDGCRRRTNRLETVKRYTEHNAYYVVLSDIPTVAPRTSCCSACRDATVKVKVPALNDYADLFQPRPS